jgi:hypothetical protein
VSVFAAFSHSLGREEPNAQPFKKARREEKDNTGYQRSFDF